MASFEPQDFGLDEHLPPPRPTTPPVRKGFLLVLLALCLLAGVVYGVPYVAERTGYAWEAGRSKAASEALRSLEKDGLTAGASALFRMATVKVSPAVVNIQAEKLSGERVPPGLPAGGGGNLVNRTLSLSLGSGVIVDKDKGYVVTNNHVVQGADRITVRLGLGTEVRARLVGVDRPTDLAVLQVNAPVRVAAEWGDSDKLSSGDWVLAIGSPYSLDHTVTAGIVSATGRNNVPGIRNEELYQDFIQTDAAINPGNSGGPLIDLNGRVIGINTAILTAQSLLRGDDNVSQTGGFEGIGLAIPSKMARHVVEDLIRTGKVVRGFLGVEPRPVTPAIAERLKLPDTRGAVLARVLPGSPADKAGLRPGDVVVALDGKDVTDPDGLRTRTAETAPGTSVALDYYREGQRRSTRAVLGDLAAGAPATPALEGLGFRVVDEPPDASGHGPRVFVKEVFRGSPAALAGLKAGVYVLAIGPVEVRTVGELERVVRAADLSQPLNFRVMTPGGLVGEVRVGGPDPGGRP